MPFALRNPLSGSDVITGAILLPLGLLGGWHLARLAHRKLCWMPSRGQWRALPVTRVEGRLTPGQVGQMSAGDPVTLAMARTTMHPTGRPMLDPDSPVALLPGRLAGTPVDPALALACYTPGSQVVLPAPTTGEVHRDWGSFTDHLLRPDLPGPVSVAELATEHDVSDALDLYAFQMRPQPKVDSVIYEVLRRYYPDCAPDPDTPACAQLMEMMRGPAQVAIQEFG